jgi:hypothetical protein
MDEDTVVDATPDAISALHAVLQADFPDELQASRITIQVLPSGEVAYRFHPVGGSDYVGGVVTTP